jgi:hypothetical protein
MTEFTPAKRGDLIAIRTERHDYVVGKETEMTITVEIGVVTSVTRDGVVKAAVVPYGPESNGQVDLTRPNHRRSISIVPQDKIDVRDALATYRQHTWPGHRSTQPYASLDEARAALRPHLRQRS